MAPLVTCESWNRNRHFDAAGPQWGFWCSPLLYLWRITAARMMSAPMKLAPIFEGARRGFNAFNRALPRAEVLSALSIVVLFVLVLMGLYRPRSLRELLLLSPWFALWQRYLASGRKLFTPWYRGEAAKRSASAAEGPPLIAIVTGTSLGGIGFWTAVQLLRSGEVGTLIVTSRTKMSGVACAEAIAREAKMPDTVGKNCASFYVASSSRGSTSSSPGGGKKGSSVVVPPLRWPPEYYDAPVAGGPEDRGAADIEVGLGPSADKVLHAPASRLPRLFVLELELGNFDSVRRFVQQITTQLRVPYIDLIVNNAGCFVADDDAAPDVDTTTKGSVDSNADGGTLINHLSIFSPRRRPRFTTDGLEIHMGANFVGTAYLSRLLFPLLRGAFLRRGRPSRLVNIGSEAHRQMHDYAQVHRAMQTLRRDSSPHQHHGIPPEQGCGFAPQKQSAAAVAVLAAAAHQPMRAFRWYGMSKLGNIVHATAMMREQSAANYWTPEWLPAAIIGMDETSSSAASRRRGLDGKQADSFFRMGLPDAAERRAGTSMLPAGPMVLAMSVHPGVVTTELFRDFLFPLRRARIWTRFSPGVALWLLSIIEKVIKGVLLLFLKTPFEGSHTSVHCALHPAVERELLFIGRHTTTTVGNRHDHSEKKRGDDEGGGEHDALVERETTAATPSVGGKRLSRHIAIAIQWLLRVAWRGWQYGVHAASSVWDVKGPRRADGGLGYRYFAYYIDEHLVAPRSVAMDPRVQQALLEYAQSILRSQDEVVMA
mgnify:CR=1 FL=1